jgi:hypothetical protein
MAAVTIHNPANKGTERRLGALSIQDGLANAGIELSSADNASSELVSRAGAPIDFGFAVAMSSVDANTVGLASITGSLSGSTLLGDSDSFNGDETVLLEDTLYDATSGIALVGVSERSATAGDTLELGGSVLERAELGGFSDAHTASVPSAGDTLELGGSVLERAELGGFSDAHTAGVVDADSTEHG